MYTEILKITDAIGIMESAEPPMAPIILRYRDAMDTDGHQMFGIYGVTTRRESNMQGVTVFKCFVDKNKPCTFYKDKNNVCWAVIPDCKENRAVLLNHYNVKALFMPTADSTVPLLTIKEAPADLIQQIDELKKKELPKIEKKTKNNVRDAFNYVKAETPAKIEGEANHQD